MHVSKSEKIKTNVEPQQDTELTEVGTSATDRPVQCLRHHRNFLLE